MALLLALPLGGCGDDTAETVEVEEPIREQDAYDGLSPAEIRNVAEPMSPEKAEALGIVDTTIHIEDPAPGEPGIPVDTAPGEVPGPE